MIGRKDGFTLVELIVVMAIFVSVIALTGSMFQSVLSHSVRQERLAESQVSDVIGLELMRVDIVQAGFGLPWRFPNPVPFNYTEAADVADFPFTGLNPSDFNDAPTGVPRSLVASNDSGYNNSDYLVVKSTNIGLSNAAKLTSYAMTGGKPVTWNSPDGNLAPGDKVIVIDPGFTKESPVPSKTLRVNGGNFFANFSTAGSDQTHVRNFYPSDLSTSYQKYLIYGIDSGSTLRMPFNRADFYIRRPDDFATKFLRCAPNTGILFKGFLNHSDGMLTELPLLDCVADMQVVVANDSDEDGDIDLHGDADELPLDLAPGGPNTPALIRNRLKAVWVFILTHEGGKDQSFTYPSETIDVGDSFNSVFRGSHFSLKDTIGTGWQNYRWKVYRILMKPKNT